MRRTLTAGVFAAVALGCSVLAQRSATKPLGAHYTAAFITGGRLVAYPFDRGDVAADLPPAFSGATFSMDGSRIYGLEQFVDKVAPPVAVATINPPSLFAIEASRGLSNVVSVSADGDGGILAVSAVYQANQTQQCGIFVLDARKGTAEHIADNPRGECFDFVSVWKQLSLSPDGSKLVATAGSGQLGVISLLQRRVEKLWPGSAAWWSPDGKWIATLSNETPAEIRLIRANDLSTERTLGTDASGRLQWSPDSRYLLLLDLGACGVGSGYFGTLEMLDVESGQRSPIMSSRCKVNHPSWGWVSDDAMK